MISTSARQCFAVGFENHPADPRIDRQPGQLPAERRELALVVDRTQLEQRLVAVANRFGPRRIEEGKLVDRAQVEREQLQDDRRQIRPLNFRRREAVAAEKVLFAEQPNADARPDAAAAALPLIGRGLRNGFDRQPLQLAAGRVAADAGGAGIDDVANARHGERRLGDVGRQHDSPAACAAERRGFARRSKGGRRAAGSRACRRAGCDRGACARLRECRARSAGRRARRRRPSRQTSSTASATPRIGSISSSPSSSTSGR